MPNSLVDSVSPYLRSHAQNPVDWRPWGDAAFAEATARDVPVLVSIGYSTCHWCHVMARESFSDPALAEVLNAGFVAIKVDREEHPEVDAAYLAAAGAFTEHLGWPLNVFVTPAGRAFYAGTYSPPTPVAGHPSFRQVLGAVREAWTERRAEVERSAESIVAALADRAPQPGDLPTAEQLRELAVRIEAFEDVEYGGFGGAPKFPSAPVLGFLLDTAPALADRTLSAMSASPLRDAVEGGFFRYSTRRDWSEPHYERMLTDNALLLDAYSRSDPSVAAGVVGFLRDVMRVGGGFASAQDSESTVDGERVEGGYYALPAEDRARQSPPALDAKVLTGWNGLAIGALADAGARLDEAEWITLARTVADVLIDRPMVRATLGDRTSAAVATLEDYGMLADGLLRLAIASGEACYAVHARGLVDACLDAGFCAPGGADPVLAARGLALEADPSEGAYPSGRSALAAACVTLHQLTADQRYRTAAVGALEEVAPLSAQNPMGFGAALTVMARLAAPARQVVVVGDLPAPTIDRPGTTMVRVTAEQAVVWAAAGFELFAGRGLVAGASAAYVCEEFVCALPVTSAEALAAQLA